MSQRDYMRRLFQEYGDNEDVLISNYAEGEKRGVVSRGSNMYELSPEEYAQALYNDGIRKGWIVQIPVKK